LNDPFCSERRSDAAAKIANACEWPDSPRKLPRSLGDLHSYLTHGFLEPTQVLVQNGISIASAFFAHYSTMGHYAPPPKKEIATSLGISGPHITRGAHGPPESSVQPFLLLVQNAMLYNVLSTGKKTPKIASFP